MEKMPKVLTETVMKDQIKNLNLLLAERNEEIKQAELDYSKAVENIVKLTCELSKSKERVKELERVNGLYEEITDLKENRIEKLQARVEELETLLSAFKGL